MNINEILQKVPDYKYFKTVDELKESSQRLAEKYPDHVALKVMGKSREGDEIQVLKIGKGSKSALLFACPHPNEPIGSMMLDFLAEELACNDELRDQYDLTWYIVKCVDPDGTRLNEDWFKGPFTPKNYGRNFYRPASNEQVEWTFPISYKTLNFNDPMPETRVLMELIEEVKPDFLYSLHNAGFGGAYFYISNELEGIYEPIIKLVKDKGVALQLGEPEMPYAVKYSDAIYQMPSIKDTYDYFAQNTALDPAEILTGGASSLDYLSQFNKEAFCLVCEVPYFYDPKIGDPSEAKMTRKEAVLKSIDLGEEIYGFIENVLDQVKDDLLYDSPFKRAVLSFCEMESSGNEAKKKWALSSKELERPATVAEQFDNITVSRFYKMLTLGMTIRLLEYEIEKRRKANNSDIDKFVKLKDESIEYFNKVNQDLEAELDYRVIPIKNLVQVQLGSALHIIEQLNL